MIYLIIWSHFLADFVFQTNQMAQNKSSSNYWLGRHILVYTFVLALILARTPYGLLFCLINGLAHFGTDYITSRITKKLWTEKKVHDFFVVIGFDQAVHLTILIATSFLLR